MENKRIFEGKRQEVIHLLANDLNQFNPTLDAFVDDHYGTIFASKITSKGICEFDRGLTKNKEPFGTYTVKYDLKNMRFLSEKAAGTLFVQRAEEMKKEGQFIGGT